MLHQITTLVLYIHLYIYYVHGDYRIHHSFADYLVTLDTVRKVLWLSCNFRRGQQGGSPSTLRVNVWYAKNDGHRHRPSFLNFDIFYNLDKKLKMRISSATRDYRYRLYRLYL